MMAFQCKCATEQKRISQQAWPSAMEAKSISVLSAEFVCNRLFQRLRCYFSAAVDLMAVNCAVCDGRRWRHVVDRRRSALRVTLHQSKVADAQRRIRPLSMKGFAGLDSGQRTIIWRHRIGVGTRRFGVGVTGSVNNQHGPAPARLEGSVAFTTTSGYQKRVVTHKKRRKIYIAYAYYLRAVRRSPSTCNHLCARVHGATMSRNVF